jgi:hypothetical protein
LQGAIDGIHFHHEEGGGAMMGEGEQKQRGQHPLQGGGGADREVAERGGVPALGHEVAMVTACSGKEQGRGGCGLVGQHRRLGWVSGKERKKRKIYLEIDF